MKYLSSSVIHLSYRIKFLIPTKGEIESSSDEVTCLFIAIKLSYLEMVSGSFLECCQELNLEILTRQGNPNNFYLLDAMLPD